MYFTYLLFTFLQVRIKFVDSGVEQNAGKKDLLAMPREAPFAHLPRYGIPCRFSKQLHGTALDSSWTQDAIEWLGQVRHMFICLVQTE